jgi:outer membrane protein TolC
MTALGTGSLAVALFIARPAAAAVQQPLDLAATVRLALAHDTTLLSKRANLANLEETFVKQHGQEYPAIAGQLQNQSSKSANAEGQFAQFGITPLDQFSQNTAQVTANWTLYNGSLNQVLAQEDRRQVESARSDLQRSQDQVAGDTSAAFYDLATRRQTVVLDVANRVYQQTLVDAAVANERAGMSAGVDVLRAQVAASRALAQLISAQADEANAREALASRIGAPLDVTFAVPELLPEPPLPATPVAQLVTIAEVSRADVAAAVATLRASQLANSAIDTDLYPQVQLTGAFGNQFSASLQASEQEQVDQENQAAIAEYILLKEIAPSTVPIPPPVLLPPVPRGNLGFWQIGLTATWTVPAIDYGARHSAHRAARAQIDSSLGALQNARSAVELDVRQSLRNAQTNSTNLGLAKQSAQLATESARISRLQYQHGLISFTDVEATEQTALSAQNDLATAGETYLVALIRFRIALGIYDPVTAVEVGVK